MSSTVQQLARFINQQAQCVNTLYEKVDLVASTGGPRTGKITNYHDVVGYLQVSKPSNIRLIGQLAVVGTLFDMASNGTDFELNLPLQGKFFVGKNNIIPQRPKNALERVRPQVILQALLINPILANDSVAMAEDVGPINMPMYDLLVLAPPQNGIQHIVRKIEFSRYDLFPVNQQIYDVDGRVATEASYTAFRSYQGCTIPGQVYISRPQEEYSIKLTAQRVKLNQPLASNRFQLVQPPGTTRIDLTK